MSLSLCMIVRDEENRIEKTIQSVAGVIDEIVIIDTGSKDGTKEKARSLGAKTFDFQWVDDFSAARNYSIEKAETEWILILDADEYLETDPGVVRAAISDQSVDAYSLIWDHPNWDIKPFYQLRKTRLFRNKGIRFEGRAHEDLFGTLNPNKWKSIGAKIIHEDKGVDPQKVDLYLSLLEKDVPQTPNLSRHHYNLGVHYYQKGKQSLSEQHFRKSMSVPDRPFYSILSTIHLFEWALNRDRDEAKDLFNAAGELLKNHHDHIEVKFHPQLKPYWEGMKNRLERSP